MRGLVATLVLLGSFATAHAAPLCASPSSPGEQAGSSAIAFTLVHADGTPIGSDTAWQPLGGTIRFTLRGAPLAQSGVSTQVCFRYAGQQFAAAMRVTLDNTNTADGSSSYSAVMPATLGTRAQPAGLLADAAQMRVVVADRDNKVLADVTTPIGITSVSSALLLAVLVTLGASAVVWKIASALNVPGSGLLKVISTRGGFASLSQLQVVLWTFVIGAGAVYVISISGSLIDISNGTLVLLGIAGVSTAASKLQNAQTSPTPAAQAAPVQQKPDAPADLGAEATDTEVALAWSAATTGGPVRAWLVQYQPAGTNPEAWRTVTQTDLRPRCRVLNLEPAAHYDFRVTPRNEFGDGTALTVKDVVTAASAVPANAPGRVVGLALRGPPQVGGLPLSWSPVVGAQCYLVQRRAHGGDGTWQPCGTTTATALLVAGEVPGASHVDLQVAAQSGEITGRCSAVLTVRPLRRPRWTDLLVTPGDTSEVDVTRMQMLLFTVITALFVAMKIVVTTTIPEIPQGFLLLMGISNGIYLTAKFIPD
jgi:hypothetical protein